MRSLHVLFVGLLLTVEASAAAPEPLWFYDGTRRYMKLMIEDFGKVHMQIRIVGQPGQASYWYADGEKVDKEITFARSVGDGEERGTFYHITTGGEGSLKVKIKPDQAKEKSVDEGVVGTYHRLPEEHRLGLARKEAELAEKLLRDAEKQSLKTWATEDKPVLAEWKTRWPAIHAKLLALRDKYHPQGEATAKPKLSVPGPNAEVPLERQPDRWFAASDLTGTALGFFNAPLDAKTKDGWEGSFNDGFGGMLTVERTKDGKSLRFNLTYTRGAEEQAGVLMGDAKFSTSEGENVAEYVDSNPQVKDPALQARLKLHKIGHYVIVDAAKTEHYATRGWFEGVYRKQPPPQE